MKINQTHLKDAFSAPDARFHASVQATLRQIQHREAARPARRLRPALAVAAALILVLALSITGIATGLFDSIFTRMIDNGFAGEPSTDYGHLEARASQRPFDQTVRFDSGATCQVTLERAYYNGQQLVLAWALKSLGESAWLYDRDDPRYADVPYGETWINPRDALPKEIADEFDLRMAEDGWAGAAWYEFTVSESPYLKGVPGMEHGFDGSTWTTEDARLYPAISRVWQDGGMTSLYIEFETPLPEAAQNLDALELSFKVSARERCHARAEGDLGAWQGYSDAVEAQEFTVSIPRSEDFPARNLHADAGFPDFSAAIDLTLTPLYASFAIESRIPDEWPAALAERSQDEFHFPMNLPVDICIDFEYWAETGDGLVQVQADIHSSDGLNVNGKLLLPEGSTALHIRPFYANSGAHPQEDVVIDL